MSHCGLIKVAANYDWEIIFVIFSFFKIHSIDECRFRFQFMTIMIMNRNNLSEIPKQAWPHRVQFDSNTRVYQVGEYRLAHSLAASAIAKHPHSLMFSSDDLWSANKIRN